MFQVGYAVVGEDGKLYGTVLNNLAYVQQRKAHYEHMNPGKKFDVRAIFAGGVIPPAVLPPAQVIRN